MCFHLPLDAWVSSARELTANFPLEKQKPLLQRQKTMVRRNSCGFFKSISQRGA
jgi:hypothetical protein